VRATGRRVAVWLAIAVVGLLVVLGLLPYTSTESGLLPMGVRCDGALIESFRALSSAGAGEGDWFNYAPNSGEVLPLHASTRLREEACAADGRRRVFIPLVVVTIASLGVAVAATRRSHELGREQR
jgi:hypothetical protein